MEFKDNLKAFRKIKGYTRSELAGKLNVSNSIVTAYETGKRKPSYEVLESISDVLNVSVDELMGKSKTFPEIFDEKIFEIIYNMSQNPELIEIIKQTPSTEKCKTCVIVQYLCQVILKFGKEKSAI